MIRSLIIITLVSCISFVSANELRVVKSPTSGIAVKLEFVDNSGNVVKTIQHKHSYGKAVSVINFSAAEAASGLYLTSPVTSILSSMSHALVNVSQALKVSDSEYKKTGLPYDSRNNITIYDRTGKIVSTLMNLTCRPIAISESANTFLCYYEPSYDPDGRSVGEHADEELKKWALYIYQFGGNQWKRSKFLGEGDYSSAMLSPNGKWLSLPNIRPLPTHTDLLQLYSLDLPAGSPPVTIFEGKKFKRYTRIGNNGEVIFDKIKVSFDANGKPVREISNTEIIYQPKK